MHPRKRRKRRRWLFGVGALLLLGPLGIAWGRVLVAGDVPSRSSGRPGRGSIAHAKPIPPWGAGFVTYSVLGSALGRQYVHDDVRATLVDAFGALAERGAPRVVVGETGWPRGGRFRPHRTHQNGMSVDLFVPLAEGRVSCWAWNRLCYGLEFDERGAGAAGQVDFAGLATMLAEIERAARAHDLRLARTILAPEYVALVEASARGAELPRRVRRSFMRRPAWVRHDEHVHLDFAPR